MKAVLNISMLLVLALSNFNSESTKIEDDVTKVALIEFTTETIDYGTIQQNSNGMRTFAFTNTGDAPLVITNVKTSCGCTVSSFSKSPILPGENGDIDIKYDTKRLGAFTKTIRVTSNAQDGNKILKIKGNIVEAK